MCVPGLTSLRDISAARRRQNTGGVQKHDLLQRRGPGGTVGREQELRREGAAGTVSGHDRPQAQPQCRTGGAVSVCQSCLCTLLAGSCMSSDKTTTVVDALIRHSMA